MNRPDPIVVVEYDPLWAHSFRTIGAGLRRSLGGVALRIDHVGSTAVAGLAAKPVIDVQVSVPALRPEAPYLGPLGALGYVWAPDNPDLTKRYFREPPGQARTHVHVRAAGSFAEQSALLFRDYLRTEPAHAGEYALAKRRLAEEFRGDRAGYVAAKDAFVWQIIRSAAAWAQRTGWCPGPSDE